MAHDAEGWARWRDERRAALCAPDGWLNLTDRVDLGDSRSFRSLGQGAGNELCLSVGPAELGRLRVTSPTSAVLDRDGVILPFQAHPGAGPRLTVAGLMLEIHTVEGQSALRVRDLSITANPDLRWFPFDPGLVVVARWEALPEPRRLGIDMAGGHADEVTVTHRACLRLGGQDLTLIPTHRKGTAEMFVIRDATSGQQSYGAGRFLLAEPKGDAIVLDFNRLHSPPCAFTPLAICPLPPPENRLTLPLVAGELTP